MAPLPGAPLCFDRGSPRNDEVWICLKETQTSTRPTDAQIRTKASGYDILDKDEWRKAADQRSVGFTLRCGLHGGSDQRSVPGV